VSSILPKGMTNPYYWNFEDQIRIPNNLQMRQNIASAIVIGEAIPFFYPFYLLLF